MRNLVVSPHDMYEILVKLGPNLREFRFDCDVRVRDATLALEALKHLQKVEVLELGLQFSMGSGEIDFDWLKHFPHPGNLREFIIRARDGDKFWPLGYEGLTSFLDKHPHLRALTISPLNGNRDQRSLMTSLKGLEKLRSLSLWTSVGRRSTTLGSWPSAWDSCTSRRH